MTAFRQAVDRLYEAHVVLYDAKQNRGNFSEALIESDRSLQAFRIVLFQEIYGLAPGRIEVTSPSRNKPVDNRAQFVRVAEDYMDSLVNLGPSLSLMNQFHELLKKLLGADNIIIFPSGF